MVIQSGKSVGAQLTLSSAGLAVCVLNFGSVLSDFKSSHRGSLASIAQDIDCRGGPNLPPHKN